MKYFYLENRFIIINILVGFVLLNFSIRAQDIEPNDLLGDTGIITIDALGPYEGGFQVFEDSDLWYLAPGSSGDITLEVSTMTVPPIVTAEIHCNTGSYGLFDITPGATLVGTASLGIPAMVTLDPAKLYVISVLDELAGMGPYFLILSGTGSLPVELSAFNAIVRENAIKLNWITATEINNYGFEIERQKSELSSQNSQWENIGFVSGSGNSSSPKYYSFIDKNIGTAGKYFYRLKQIDNDGIFEYSGVVEINNAMPVKFELSQNFPNPFNPTTKIKFAIPSEGINQSVYAKLNIYDILGNEIVTLINGEIPFGEHEVEFNADGLTSGIYIYNLEAGDFRATRKMQLIR